MHPQFVSSEELDSEMYKDMQNCAGKSIFRNEDNLDEDFNENNYPNYHCLNIFIFNYKFTR